MRESVSKVARLAGGPRSTRGAREGERQMEESKNTFSRRQFVELLGVSAAGFGLVSMAGCERRRHDGRRRGRRHHVQPYGRSARARPGVLRRRRVRSGQLQHPRGPVPVRRQGCEGRPVPGSRSARDLGRRQGVHHQAARRRQVPRRRRVQRGSREEVHRAPARAQPQLRHALRVVRVRREGGGQRRRNRRGRRSHHREDHPARRPRS